MKRAALLLLLCAVETSAAVTGRVVDEDGKPLRGARVRVRALETPEQAHDRILSKEPEPVYFASAETNDSGAFRIDAKGNAVVEMKIESPGRQFNGEDVVDGEDAGTFVLKAAPLRRGRVTADGRGVAGAAVVIGRSYVTRTDAGGFYEAPEPAEGFQRIQVIHPDYAITDRPLRMRSPQDPMNFDVGLQAGHVVRGRVIDAAGSGVGGAVVRAQAWPMARTREDGSFEIAHASVEKPLLFAREGDRVGSLVIDRATPPYVIRLRPAASVAGTVRSSRDEMPVAAARISIRSDFENTWWPTAITDAKGNFVLDGVDPGARRMFVAHPAFFGGNTMDVRLQEGARVSRIVYVTPFARVSGKVIDEEKRPISAARVRIVGAGGGTTTAPDGTFSLRFPAFERAQSLWVLKQPLPIVTYGPFSAEPGETKSGLLLRVPNGIRFELRLVDRDGAPVGSEPLALMRRTDPEVRYSRAPMPCGADLLPCRTDRDGRLTLTLVEGAYDILAGGETTVRRELNDQMLTARASPMTIEVERGATIEGRVVWSDGSPVNIRAVVTSTMTQGVMTPVNDSAFAIRNIAAGKISLIAEAAVPPFSQSEPVEVTAPASGVLLKLPRPGRIEGRVADRETDRPLREFTVTLQRTRRGRPIPSKSFRSDDGRFVLDDVAPGTYNITAEASGYTRTNATPITVEEQKTASAQLALDRGGIVLGRVTAEGRALAGAQVAVSFSHATRSGFVPQQTDANGEYTIDGLPPGSHKLEVRRQGFAAKSIAVTVTAGKETRADVELSRGMDLRGRVLDPAGRPMAMAEVSARSAGGLSPGSIITTDSDGSFRLTGLDQVTYTIVAQKEGYVEGKVEVNPTTTSDITITLSRGGTITGRVLGVSPAELQFVQVRAYSVRNHAQPDATGAFTLTGVPDGDVTVTASMYRPQRRDATAQRVKVVGGVAPAVEIDFGAGIAVRGRVTQRGQLVEGYITFSRVDPREPHSSASVEISRDGTYEVRMAAPGEYQVMVSRHGFIGNVIAGRVNISGDMVHDIDLRGTSLSGIVADAATRAPIAGASVMILPGHEVRTNAAGRFVFDLVTDGEYRLNAVAEGYAPELRMLSVQNGFAPELELLLSQGLTASFRVFDPEGRLAEINGVGIMDAARNPVYNGNPAADANGVRRIQLQPGSYTLMAFARDYAATPVTLTVPGPVIDVRLQRQKR